MVSIQYLKTDGQANSIAKYVGSFSIAKQIHLGYNECIFEDFSPNFGSGIEIKRESQCL